MQLEVGKKYRGSGMINEYGEVQFTAYQQGNASTNALKKVTSQGTENAQFGIYASKELCSIRLTVTRGDRTEMERALRNIFVTAMTKLEIYEI